MQHLPVTISLGKLQHLNIKKQTLQSPFLNSENHPVYFCLLKVISFQCSKIPLLYNTISHFHKTDAICIFTFFDLKEVYHKRAPAYGIIKSITLSNNILWV